MTMTNQSDSIQLFHNPHCSKSRAMLSLLTERGIKPVVIEYLVTPPTTEELTYLLKLLNLEPRQLMRKHEAVYKENNLDNITLSHQQLIQAMVDNPILIERPIVIKGNHALIGRPVETVLRIL